MKSAKSFFISTIVIAFMLVSMNAMSQSKSKFQKVEIKTSAQCGMCKDRIEAAFAFEKGVKKADLNLTTKVATITYDPNKTNPEKFRQILSKLGYDADDVPSDPVAYSELPKCCQKPATDQK
jgi:periplasmic mercuric ion binding protein